MPPTRIRNSCPRRTNLEITGRCTIRQQLQAEEESIRRKQAGTFARPPDAEDPESDLIRQRYSGHPVGQADPVRLVREELGRLGWKEAGLAQRRKGEPGKVRIARRLRHETTMTLKWITERLQMGGWTYVSNLLKGHGARSKTQQKARFKSED